MDNKKNILWKLFTVGFENMFLGERESEKKWWNKQMCGSRNHRKIQREKNCTRNKTRDKKVKRKRGSVIVECENEKKEKNCYKMKAKRRWNRKEEVK